MDNQKLFLVIAISLSVFLLWDKWQIQHTVDNSGKTISQTVIHETSVPALPTTVSQSLNVPSAPSNNAQLILPEETNTATPFITVITDLLTLEINRKGGTIQNAWLNRYPVELNSEQKFQLLNNNIGNIFHAQSGLLPQNQLPTHHALFSADNAHYQMIDGRLTVPLKWQSDGIEVVKSFHFKKGSYVVEVSYDINNNSNNTVNASSYLQLARNEIDQSNLMMPTFSGGAKFNDEQVYEKIDFEDFNSTPKTTSKGGWTAMIQHYFFAAIIPNQEQTHSYSSKINGDKYLLTAVSPSTALNPGTSMRIANSHFYIGPKEQAQIDNAAPGLDKTVDYGILFIIAKPLSEILHWIYSYVNSWGYAIIILTILIKLAFYKLSEKSYRSMAGMRKLAPRLAKLKETYGDDRQKMGQKTMALYKKEKINPASGCLPIVVQIPVFISLYWVLLEMVELRQTSFWYLADLSAQDPYYILPVIMGVSMFVQQRLNPPPADPMQAKIMMALPLVFTVFFLWFPSGLVLYWVVNNILSIAQQWVINKRING